MKNFKYFLASLLLLAVAGARAEQVEVRTASELQSALQANSSADILLKADIDLSAFSAAQIGAEHTAARNEGFFKTNWNYHITEPLFGIAFAGTICGLDSAGGKPVVHRISGLRRPLFKTMNKAKVSSIVIADSPVYYNQDGAGALACTMDGTVIEGVFLSGVQVTSEQDHCCGSVAGEATGCTFRAVVANDCKVRGDGLYAGGLVGRSSGSNFEGSWTFFNTSVWCEGRFLSFSSGLANSADCGGLVGLSSADTFTGCINMGIVGAEDDGVGGIAGHAVQTSFTGCQNWGCVFHANLEAFNETADAIVRSIVADLPADMHSAYEKGGSLLLAGLTDVLLAVKGATLLHSAFHLANFVQTAGYVIEETAAEVYSDMGGLIIEAMEEFVDDAVGVAAEEAAKVTIAAEVSEAAERASAAYMAGVGAVLSIAIVTFTTAVIHHAATGYDDLGGICGRSEGSHFSLCTNKGQCAGVDGMVGGIVGYGLAKDNQETLIEDCLNRGKVSGRNYVGGICGRLNQSGVNNCLNVGTTEISSMKEGWGEKSIGHIFGAAEFDSHWHNNYQKDASNDFVNIGRISVNDEALASGLVGWWLNGSRGAEGPWHQNLLRVSNGKAVSADGYDLIPVPDAARDDLSAAYMAKAAKYFANWCYPCCYWVQNGDDLEEVAYALNHTDAGKNPCIITFTADVDMEFYPDFEPIGTKTRPFCGLVLGNGHSVDNLQTAGLFGATGIRAEILDLTVMLQELNAPHVPQPEGIAEAPALSPSQAAAPVCDLQGRAAKASRTRGLLIQGGKKLFVK